MSASRAMAMLGAAAALAPATTRAAEHVQHHAPAVADGFASEMHRSMETMMRGMNVPISGNPDRDFLAMMIPHHQGAVAMARLVLVHGRDPLTRQLAEGIIAAQQAEIAAMEGRLRLLSSGDVPDEFPALSGTRGPA